MKHQNRSSEELRNRLDYLLSKVEWDKEDMEWMLAYLESGDVGLKEILRTEVENMLTCFEMGDSAKMKEFWLRILNNVMEALDK